MPVSRPPSAERGRLAVLLTALGAGLLLFCSWDVPARAQTFRSAIDLIAVDVQVRDRLGNPVHALTPDRFTVTIDGRKRRVVSADLARFEVSPTAGAAWPLTAPTSVNPISMQGPTGEGRTFIVAVDTASFRALDVNMALSAAGRFVRGLLPDDAVGVFSLPNGPYLEPTTSHTAVLDALSKIVGTRASSPSQMDMSIEQVIDITAAAATQPMMQARATVQAMVSAPEESGDPPVDCPGTRVACTEAAIAEASGLATALEEDVFRGIQGLDTLLRSLRATPVRKTVLLFSAGMPVADRSGGRPSLAREVRLLGEQAAYANASIHTMYFDTNIINEFSLESRRPKSSTGRTRVINTRALAEFTEPSGGALIEVGLGVADREIDRLLGEISTYYVLGVEPEARDRDGRPHRLDVKVSDRNVQLRSRQLLIIPRGN
jgi:VWFA-related protein